MDGGSEEPLLTREEPRCFPRILPLRLESSWPSSRSTVIRVVRYLRSCFSVYALASIVTALVTIGATPRFVRSADCEPTRWEDEWRRNCADHLEPKPEIVREADKLGAYYVVAADGSTYLIPRRFLPLVRGHGPAREFGIEMRLPDFRTFESRKESARMLGFQDRILAHFHPTNLYRGSGLEELVTEWQMKNRINSAQKFKILMNSRPANRPNDFIEYTSKLVDERINLNNYWKNNIDKDHKDNDLIDVTHILGWRDAYNMNSTDRRSYYVSFRNNRLIMHMRCSRPGSAPSPSCWATFHLPGKYLYLSYMFGVTYGDQEFFRNAVEYGDRIYSLLGEFRRAAERLESSRDAR